MRNRLHTPLAFLLLLTSFGCAHAAPAPLRVLIVDPSHSDTGELCAKTLAAIPDVSWKKVDVPQLAKAAEQQWDTVVWIAPEPLLYKDASKAAFDQLTSKTHGLLIVGLSHDKPGREALFKTLANRGAPKPGVHLEKHLEQSFWIWTAKTKDETHAYLRKTFEIKELPPRAWIQCTADNKGIITVNGTVVGTSNDWKDPTSFDVTRLLHVGKNVIAIDGYNNDGPAGILFDLAGISPTGKVMFDIISDKSWKAAEASAPGWMNADFDDSAWAPAFEVADINGGYWAEKIHTDYQNQEYALRISDGDHAATAGLSDMIGRAVVLDGLDPGNCETIVQADAIPIGVAGEGPAGRLILLSTDPDKTKVEGKERALLSSNGFGDFLLQSVLWLNSDHKTEVRLVNWRVPETATGGQDLKLNGFAKDSHLELTVRDDNRELLHKTENHTGGDLHYSLPLPASWELTGPVHVSIVARDDKGVVAVRGGTIQVLDPVRFTWRSPTSRWVFRPNEPLTVEATLLGDQPPPMGHLAIYIEDSTGQSSALPIQRFAMGKASCSLPGLNVGKYAAVAKYIADGTNSILGQQRYEFQVVEPASSFKGFPVSVQFTPLPFEGVAMAQSLPESQQAQRRLLDNMIDHGVTTLYTPTGLPHENARDIEGYAQSKGLTILHWFERPAELFNRDEPPKFSLYSKEYAKEQKERIAQLIPALDPYPRLQYAYLWRDEPFHNGYKSFGYTDDEKLAFSKKYEYGLGLDPETARADPERWLDLLTFRSDYFLVGWRQCYKMAKEMNSSFPICINHDSHNTFGGGYGQESKIAIDDVFHWGADWCDALSYDIYPYLMTDFRYGPNRWEKMPRMSSTHYGFAWMRDLTTAYNKPMGFFVGTYNPEWYDLTEQGATQYWMEREMAYTALAAGCDYLVTGIGIPIESKHWEDFGDAMRTVRKVGEVLEQTKKPQARAAMLFPRTQTLELQEEYFNVSQSYEEFLRAFGELDLIHEEQLDKGKLDEYKILILFDVKLLPKKSAETITKWIENGGTVIADCVPNLDENRMPTDAMSKIFGVRNADTTRILWPAEVKQMRPAPAVKKPRVPGKTTQPATKPTTKPTTRKVLTTMPMPPNYAGAPSTQPTAQLTGAAIGVQLDIPLVSPRFCVPTTAQVLLKASTGDPGVLQTSYGSGKLFLLGFCLQDTTYESYRSHNLPARQAISQLLSAMADQSGAHSHVHSSNPDVEAAVRTSAHDAIVIVVSHEAKDGNSHVWVQDLPFKASKIVDVASDKEIPFQHQGDRIEFDVNAPNATSFLLHMTP